MVKHIPVGTGEPATAGEATYDYWRPCDTCGGDFRVRACYARKALAQGRRPPRFCSRKCRDTGYLASGNPKWRGGRLVGPGGYVLIYAPDHPNNCKGYVQEHRLVMEAHLGRYLKPTECVHHFNHDRQDNRLENLELMNSWAEHQRRHGYYEPRECGNCGRVVMRSRSQRRNYPKRSFCSRRCAAAVATRASVDKARQRSTRTAG